MNREGNVRNNLRSTRSRLGLSQQELAAAAGITRQTVSGIEGGLYSPSAAVALRLARALACRVEDLFWLEEDAGSLIADPAESFPDGEARVAVARVGERWVAHPLHGDHAFRTEMIPCDGVGVRSGPGVSVRLLDEPGTLARTVAIAGCTPALSLWARAAERWNPGLRVLWTFANSMAALGALARGEVHAAGLHLFDPESEEYNTPFVRRMLADQDVVLINLGVWEEGLLVRPGNPKGFRRGADLARRGVTLVNREEGAGSRLLLEELLRKDGVTGPAIAGYEQPVHSHEEVARAVAFGRADVGVSSACVAAAFGLGFVPLREVRYDLALLRAYLEHPPVRQLLATLDNRWVRSQLNVLGGYNTARTGETVAEVGAPC